MPKQINNYDVVQLFRDRDVNMYALFVLDTTYAIPKKDWFLVDFSMALSDFRATFLNTYQKEWADCDNFSSMAFFLAQALNASTRGVKDQLSVFEFAYTRRDGEGHAIIGCIVWEEGEHRLVFMEPQTSKELKLNIEEIKSCRFCRF